MKTAHQANQTMLDLNHPYSTTQEWVGNAKQLHSQTGIGQRGKIGRMLTIDLPR